MKFPIMYFGGCDKKCIAVLVSAQKHKQNCFGFFCFVLVRYFCRLGAIMDYLYYFYCCSEIKTH